MAVVMFRGEPYHAARYLFCEVTQSPNRTGILMVGPTTPDFTEVRAYLLVTKQPNYSDAVWSYEDFYGPWCSDLPQAAFEAAALLLCMKTKFYITKSEMRLGPWGWPIKETVDA